MGFFSFLSDVLGLSSLKDMFSTARRAVKESLGHKHIEAYLLKRTLDRFQPAGYKINAQKDPDGNAWAPLGPTTVARRKRNRNKTQALMDTGALYLSIKVLDEGTEYFSIGVPPGSTLHTIANLHQYGGQNKQGAWVPARPFIGVGEADRKEIGDLVFRRLNAELG